MSSKFYIPTKTGDLYELFMQFRLGRFKPFRTDAYLNYELLNTELTKDWVVSTAVSEQNPEEPVNCRVRFDRRSRDFSFTDKFGKMLFPGHHKELEWCFKGRQVKYKIRPWVDALAIKRGDDRYYLEVAEVQLLDFTAEDMEARRQEFIAGDHHPCVAPGGMLRPEYIAQQEKEREETRNRNIAKRKERRRDARKKFLASTTSGFLLYLFFFVALVISAPQTIPLLILFLLVWLFSYLFAW